MQDIKQRIIIAKKRISEVEKKQKELDKNLKEILNKIFSEKSIGKHITDFYIRANSLIIKTNNKVFTSEIFLKKEEILKELKKEILVENIIIK